MTIIDDALADLDRQKKREVGILRALLQVDLQPVQRQRLLEALRSEGLLS
ncbi:hypothetical protein [Synechococcus sp. CB0101]|nr:hypothetical protein [Synechococcus sp. CB0101]